MNDIATVLAENIQKYRKKCGLTQDQLAKKLNLSFQSVSKWENSKSVPDALLLPKLAEIFSCSIDDLFSYDIRKCLDFVSPQEFDALWEMVDKQRRLIEKSDIDGKEMQIIAMMSPDSKQFLMFVNHIGSSDEDDMLYDMARDDVTVDRIICMWVSGKMDIPSYIFLQGLVTINPKNKDAKILLLSRDGFVTVTVGSIICESGT